MITKDMMIGEVVEKYPMAATLMEEFGLHCFGCHSNPSESIEAGVLSHGFSATEVEMLVTELNKLAVEPQVNKNSEGTVMVTETAAGEIKNLLESQKKADHGLKVKVVAGGCAGFKYEINFVKEPAQGDTTIESNGLKLFVDPQSMNYLKGCQIDYTSGLMNAGFKVINPNEKHACGCGSSIGF